MNENKNNSAEFDISVIMPIYNIDEPFLRACLDSVLKQTKDKLEVIMVDDGSTNNSGEVADEYAKKYPYFTCYHIPNGGVSRARNFGVTKAKGKYIYFVDSDDIITEDMLEKLYITAERDGSEVAVCGAERFSSVNEWDSFLHLCAFRNIDSLTHIKESPDLLFDAAVWNKLIRRDFWEKHNISFPVDVLYEDIPAMLSMHYLANKVSVIKSIDYLWRVRDMETKSITQNTADLSNLTGRIHVLKMLDEFFEENVKEESLKLELQKRIIHYDMMLFFNACLGIPKEDALKNMEIIRDYISEAIPAEAFSYINLVEKRIYKALFENDYERFIQIVGFRRRELKNCPCFEKDGKIFVKLPESIFPEGCCDIGNDISQTYPTVLVNNIVSEPERIEIEASLFIPKVNITKPDEQKLEAVLCDYYSGKEYPLEVQNFENTEITKKKGTTFSSVLGEEKSYNYDGTGYRIIIDSESFRGDAVKNGVIVLKYSNRFSKGKALLKNLNAAARKKADGFSCIFKDSIIRTSVAPGETPAINCEKIGCTLLQSTLSDSKLHFSISKNLPLFAVDDSKNALPFEEAEDDYCISFDELENDKEYGVFYKSENGALQPLIRTNKAVNLISDREGVFVVRSNKTHNVSIRPIMRATFLRNIERENDVVRFTTVSAGKRLVAGYSSARIVVDDVIMNKKVVLASAKCTAEKKKYVCDFEIDFSDEEIQKNLYKSNREVFIEYLGDGKKTTRQRIFSSKHFNQSFEYGTLGIVFDRCLQGNLRLRLQLNWSEEELTKEKRDALTSKNYPEYRKAPIQKNLILFESTWGTKYNCNPRAIYEYINNNYPQYECVWAFNDPRTPINGRARRIRRKSQEYFKALSTAKYLISNVNFGDAYVKREGQIVLQTMHGTPLKTFGLDIWQEMAVPGARESLIKRCSNWDYLIVQGEFMKNKAPDMFLYNKEILETGYPRTDILYAQTDVDKIKSSLGIPKDKKVILYTPTFRIRHRFIMQLDTEKMRKALGDDYVLLVRVHYFTLENYDVVPDNKFVFDVSHYASVQDLYQISDMLITDYSSVMFDYALLEKPMIFYAYDLETYSEATRGVYFDIREEAPGPITFTTDEVINAVINIDDETKKVEKRTAAFKNKYLTYENSESTKKVVEKVLKPSKAKAFMLKANRKIKKKLDK